MDPDAGRLLVRADAGPRIGAGHVMRCLALAQAWQDAGGEVLLASAALPPALAARLAAEAVESLAIRAPAGSAADAEATLALARERSARWIVADGYHFDAGFQAALASGDCRVLALDDTGHAGRYAADVVLNPNLHADERAYRERGRRTRLLLGLRYAPLRREFRRWTRWTREPRERVARLLVSVGGGEWDRLLGRLIDAVAPLAEEGLEVEVVYGEPRRLRPRLEAAGLAARVRVEPAVEDMPGLMARSDLALSAAGSTCWELAFMSVPALVFSLAANQRLAAEAFGAAGAALDLGRHEALEATAVRRRLRGLIDDEPARRAMMRRGRELVDGEGAARVVAAMLDRDGTGDER